MPFINGGHIWLILGLIVLLVIFGPGKLPELGTAVGKTVKAFRKSTDDLKAEISIKSSEPSDSVRLDQTHNQPISADQAGREG